MSTEKGEANPADKADTPTASTRDDRTTEGTGTVNAQRFLTQGLSNFNSIAREHFNNNGGGSNKIKCITVKRIDAPKTWEHCWQCLCLILGIHSSIDY